MSGGEKMYDALMKGVVNSITFKWEPDWFDFAQPLYEAFIEDVKEDFEIMALCCLHDKVTRKLLPDAEVTLRGWIDDNSDQPDFGKSFPLSDILFDLYENTDEEDFEILLERSIAEARKKIAIYKLRRSYP